MSDLLNTTPIEKTKVTLVDVLDKVLEKGAVINGDMVIRVADVDLVFLGLRLILTSVSKAEELSGESFSDPDKELTPEDKEYIKKLQKEIRKAEENIPTLIDLGSPKKTEQGLAKLILSLVELIRRLMEKEAFRRVKKGTLSPAEVQKLGLSLKAVKKKMKEVQAIFGIEDEELNLDLGPLGDLM
ncbi:MAG: gas vesicle protein GvpJ [bacterium]